jgi:shikimate 5-dehydrogenase
MADDFVEVYRGGGGQFRAEMLRSLLSGSGIESVVAGGSASGLATNIGAIGEFAIVVRATDADRAAEILRTFEQEGAGEIEELEWEDDEDADE